MTKAVCSEGTAATRLLLAWPLEKSEAVPTLITSQPLPVVRWTSSIRPISPAIQGGAAGKSDVGGEAGERQRHQPPGEAVEGEPVARPEPAGEGEGDDEVGGVDEGEEDVPPVDDAGVVELVLQPLGRGLAAEDEAVEVDHRVVVDADPQRVGRPPGQVVDPEHGDDRQPVDDQLEDFPRRPPDRDAGEGAAGPEDHQLALDRDPVGARSRPPARRSRARARRDAARAQEAKRNSAACSALISENSPVAMAAHAMADAGLPLAGGAALVVSAQSPGMSEVSSL